MKTRKPKKSPKRSVAKSGAKSGAKRKAASPSRRKASTKTAKGPVTKVLSTPRRTPARKKAKAVTKASRSAPSNGTSKTEPRARPRRTLLLPKSHRRRSDDADAFLRVRRDGGMTKDDLAEELGEDFVGSATSGEEQGLKVRDTVLDEESGGPFVTTPAKREFAEGFDASNPEDALREPFPSAQSEPEPFKTTETY
jgi:hypothetical protein